MQDCQPIAIVGLACRLPGADDCGSFWKLLVEGRDAAIEIPNDLLDRQLYYSPTKGDRGKTYSTVAALEPRLPFDNSKCRLKSDEIARYDPCHLTMCEVASEALRDAGLNPFELPTRRVGVYFGHTGGSEIAGDLVYCMYAELAAQYLGSLPALADVSREVVEKVAAEIVQEVRDQYDHVRKSDRINVAATVGARLISKAFGLDGPCMVIDAACASSMQAIAIGARALTLGSVEMAIVGGASYFKRDSQILFSQAQSASATASRPFDADADGLLTAEGNVTFVLKTLKRAIADGDRVRAVIRGIGVSSDGKGKSLWAPLKTGQVLAMNRAYGEQLSPGAIQYVEAHATSTQVGDATEVSALAEMFPKQPGGAPIWLGGVKGNVGHTLETAGAAGIAKAVLAMEHRTIPPNVNLNQLNPEIPWQDLAFRVPTKAIAWELPPQAKTRLAAVNAFGIGGLNVHCIVEEFRADLPPEHYGVSTTDAADNEEPIAIIGYGAILPGALDAAQLAAALAARTAMTGPVPPDRWDRSLFRCTGNRTRYRTRCTVGGFITGYQYDWRRHKVPPKQVANANPLQFMLLDAAEHALRQAGYDPAQLSGDRIGVMVGTMFGGDFSSELQMGLRVPEFVDALSRGLQRQRVQEGAIRDAVKEFSEKVFAEMPALLDETGSFTSSTLASRLTKTFNLKGGAASIDAGGASGGAVLSASIDVLRTRECDMVVCAAGQRSLDVTLFEALDRQDLLRRDENDDRDEAWTPGEGCAVVLLKRFADAQRDGNRILGLIRSGNAVAAHDDVNQGCQQAALQDAVAAAGIEPANVDLVEDCAVPEKGGCAPWPGAAVSRQLTEQFGFMGAVQPLAGVVKSIIEAERSGRQSTVAIRSGANDAGYYNFIMDAASELRRFKPVRPTAITAAATDEWKITRYDADSYHVLAERLSAGKCCEQGYTAGRFRLTIVARGGDHHRQRALLAAQALAAGDALAPETITRLRKEGVFLGEPKAGGLAFVFPGQGSQYGGMLGELLKQSAVARGARDRVDAVLQAIGSESFADLTSDANPALGHDVWTTQASILAASYILNEVLASFGVRPDVVAGHSFGEYAALVAARAWGLADAFICARGRAEAIDRSQAAGGMLALSEPAETVAELIAKSASTVYLANINGPRQTVVAGEFSQIDAFAAELKSQGVAAMRLPVPRPFHCDLMRGARDRMAAAIDGVHLSDTACPVVTTAFWEASSSASHLRQSLVEQLVRPVNFLAMAGSLHQTAPTAVVEVGPRQALTKFVKRVDLWSADNMIAADNASKPGLEGLLEVVAHLETLCSSDAERPVAPSRRRRTAEIIEFDATARRRKRLRRASQATDSPQTKSRAAIQPVAVDAPREAPPAHRNGKHAAQSSGSGSVLAAAPPATRSLESMLVEFVVEQTGYPEEMVDFTSDLEADLGIDSIKKAQMFGELGERLGLAPRADLSLDDFPTLGHVRDYLRQQTGAPAERPAHTSRSRLEPSVNGSMAAVEGGVPVFDRDVQPTVAVAVEASSHVAESSSLESMLVEFVVEQTGYPEEMVDFTSDLEADLGIDSIKKAQMFGELGERLGLAPRADLSLDDFPTLGHVRDYLRQQTGAPAERPAHTSRSRLEPSVNGAMAAVEGAVPVFDREVQPAVAVALEASSHVAESSSLESMLVEFVVEQTGYPEEMVDFTSDLEADLGIDSIKKAQMFGELGERLGLAPRADLSLDDFPTLGHVRDYLRQQTGGPPAPPQSSTDAQQTPESVHSLRPVDGATAPIPVVWLPTFDAATGRRYAGRFHAELRRRAELAVDWADRPSVVSLPPQWNEFFSGLAAELGLNVGIVNRFVGHSLAAPACFSAAAPAAHEIQGALAAHVIQRRESDALVATVGLVGSPVGLAGVNQFGVALEVRRVDETAPALPADYVASMLATSFTIADVLKRLDSEELPRGWVALAADLAAPNGAAKIHRAGDQGTAELQTGFVPALAATGSAETTDFATGRRLSFNWRDVFDSVATLRDLDDDAPGVMKRYTLGVTPQPAVVGEPFFTAKQRVAVIGEGAYAGRIADRLRDRGAVVEQFRDRTTLEMQLGKHLAAGAVDGLVIALGPWAITGRFAEELWPLFRACQQWASQPSSGKGPWIAAATHLGGDFGFSGASGDPSGGAITGLFKAIRREMPGVRTKVADFSLQASPDDVSELLLSELVSGDPQLEVGYLGEARQVVAAAQAPVAPPLEGIVPGSVWIVTGGARGIAAEVALELGRRFGCHLHLVGSTPLADDDAKWRNLDEHGLAALRRDSALESRRLGMKPTALWNRYTKEMELERNLRRFADARVDAEYHTCDVASAEAVESLVSELRARHGGVHGVIHAAGVEAACRFSAKTQGQFRDTVAAKCDGALNLLTATDGDPLRWFIAFGSTSGRFGGLGQTDYSLASDLLAKIAGRAAATRAGCRAICFHWPAWDEVGMAARPESRVVLAASGMKFLPPKEGAAHLIRELVSGSQASEVLILDSGDLLDTDGVMDRSVGVGSQTRAALVHNPKAARQAGAGVEQPAETAAAPSANLADVRLPTARVVLRPRDGSACRGTRFAVEISPQRDAVLTQHLFNGKPMLPAACTMDLFCQAAAALQPGGVVKTLRDVSFSKGLVIEPGDSLAGVEVTGATSPGGVCITLEKSSARGGAAAVHATGIVVLADSPTSIAAIDPGRPVYGWTPYAYPPQEASPIWHGPAFRTFRELDFQHGGGRARISVDGLPALFDAEEQPASIVPIAILDGVLVACAFWGYAMLERRIGIPRSMGELLIARQPRSDEVCTLRFFYRGETSNGDLFDGVLLGDSGDAVFQFAGFETTVIQK